MSTMDAALFSRLSAHAGLQALAGTRIYPAPAPQNAAYPLATYQEVSRVPVRCMQGAAILVHIRYQVDSWAVTLAGAKAVAAEVEAALDGWSGIHGGITIKNCFLETGRSMDYDPADCVHRYLQEFEIEYSR